MKHVTLEMAAAILLGAGFGRADAQRIGSFYTSTAPKDCRTIGKPSELDGSTTRVCPGKAGLMVLAYVSGDNWDGLRITIGEPVANARILEIAATLPRPVDR